MEAYKTIYLIGTPEILDEFKRNLIKYSKPNWKFSSTDIHGYRYLLSEYKGTHLPCVISIYEDTDEDMWRVNNIIPAEKNSFEIHEYNEILMKFYEDILKEFSSKELIITKPISENEDPYDYIDKIPTPKKTSGVVYKEDLETVLKRIAAEYGVVFAFGEEANSINIVGKVSARKTIDVRNDTVLPVPVRTMKGIGGDTVSLVQPHKTKAKTVGFAKNMAE